MSVEMPIYLKQLEPLTGALEMLRYLSRGVASADDLIDSLGLSDRSFDKAKRRLVTNQYIAARSDGILELTQKGKNAAHELLEYDRLAGDNRDAGSHKIARRVLVAVPRVLVAGQPAPVTIGFEPDSSGAWRASAEVVLRLSALYASVNVRGDQTVSLGRGVARTSLELTPEFYDQARLRVQIFQLSPDGEDITDCGGIFLDINVQADGEPGSLVAHSATIQFNNL
ncbi:MAG: hypothetical protein MUE40_02670 [Anaerolineae bacterium]|jgi:hypothetical protein|nr:hypothetical protein [Anaerolineae bacterium]